MSLNLFKSSARRISSPLATRAFSASSIVRADEFALAAIQKERAQKKEASKKDEQRKLLLRRAKAREPADRSPFYHDINTALRYLRAAEVGRSPKEAVITITTEVVADRGAPKLTGSIIFPKAMKEVRTLVFTTEEEQAEAARNAGVTLVGGTELIDQIRESKIDLNFDRAFATPEMAPLLNPVARQLGPKGLMPNAKRGTVVKDLASVLNEVSGSIPFRQTAEFLNVAVGRVNFTDREIIENIVATSNAFREAIASQKSKKKSILGQTTITSTHGPGIVIDFK